MAQTLGTLLINVQADTQHLVKGFDRAERSVNKTTKTMTNSVKALTAAFIGLGAVDLARSFTQRVDAMTLINSRLKLVTKSTQELITAEKELFKISQNTRQSFGETVDLYSRIARSTKTLNLSQNELLDVTDTINKALIVSGGSAESMRAALVQLGQGFNRGTLRGEEFNSVAEQTPRLAFAIADGMGIARDKLKEFADQGKITSKAIIDALTNQRESVEKDFDLMTKTIQGSQQQISNALLKTIGVFDDISGFSKAVSEQLTTVSKSLDGVAENLPEIIENSTRLAKIIGVVGISYIALNKSLKLYNGISQVAVTRQVTLEKATKAQAKAQTLAIKSVQKLNLANAIDTDLSKKKIKSLNSQSIVLRNQSKKQAIYATSLRKTAAVTNLTTKATRLLSATLKTVAPIAIATAIIAIADAFLTASDNADKLNDTVDSTTEKLKKLTTNQLSFRKLLLEEEITKQIAKEFEAQYQLELGRDRNNERLIIQRKAKIDEEKAKLEELRKKLLEINKIQEEVNKPKKTILPGETSNQNQEELLKIQKSLTEVLNPRLAAEFKINEKYDEMIVSLEKAGGLQADIFDIEKARSIELDRINEKYKKQIDDVLELGDFDFKIRIDASGFDAVSKSIISLTNSFGEINDEQKAFNDFTKEFGKIQKPTLKDKEKFNKAEEKHLQNQTNGYMAVAGAISGMFAQGSREAAAFQAIQSAIAIVSGVTAILSQGKGDPHTAVARMAAMAASVASFLSSAGIAFGGGSVSTTSDAFSAQAENLGRGSILGDTSQGSESISESLNTLEDFAQPQFRVLSEMNKSLNSIDQKIGGVASLLIQQGGFGFGEGFITPEFNDKGLGVSISKIAEDIPVLNIITGVIGSIVGGLFGKTSRSQELRDFGINFNKVLLTSAIDQLTGQTFQTIATTVTKKSWFRSSSSTTIRTFFESLDDEMERQFSLVLSGLLDTTILAGQALDRSSSDIESSLTNFIVNIGKISTKGKTGEQIQEQISNIFSRIGDDIAKTAFPELTEFQQIGEGMFSTLTRVATGMEEAEFFISRLGNAFDDIKFTDIINKQGNVGFEALAQSIIKADEAAFGFNNGVVQIINSLDSTAEELFNTFNILEDVRVNLALMGQTAANLSTSMIVGAGSINELSDATDSYFENFLTDQEQLASNYEQLNKEFLKLDTQMPGSVQGFKDLISSIDTSTDSGAELFGRLISLSDGFSDVFGSAQDNIDILLKLRNTFLNLGDTVGKTIDSLIGGTDSAAAKTIQIENFWKKRNEANVLLAKESALTSEEQSRLSGLVGEINSLATTIQSSSIENNALITSELISNLSDLQSDLNLKDEILSVNIVGINSNLNLLNGITPNVPNISNIINNTLPSNNTDFQVTLNNILDKISLITDYTKDLKDNSDGILYGNVVQKVEVVS